MKFEITPILSIMEEVYSLPISAERFQLYISKLQGKTNGDLDLPISGFNPMAKEHVSEKISELKSIDAEGLISGVIEKVNVTISKLPDVTIKVILNLADDLKGGWTNRYTTDFDSKFKLNALVARSFCTPYFWTSENYSEFLIKKRTEEYIHRTIYWLTNPKPKILEDYLNQEIYVSQQMEAHSMEKKKKEENYLQQFYEKNKKEDQYNILFNFFYGDNASESLNFPVYGINKTNGFEYAKFIAKKSY